MNTRHDLPQTKENYTAWTIHQYSEDDFYTLDPETQLRYLCMLGHLAPSTHNTQPWRFFIDSESYSIDVYVDRDFVLPASDVNGRQAIISIGCALENIVIAGERFGLNARVTPDAVSKEHVAPYTGKNCTRLVHVSRIEFTKDPKQKENSKLFISIFTRKVMRAEYDPKRPIPQEILKNIQEVPDGVKTKLHIVTDAMRKLGISEFQGQADGFVINSTRFAKELGEWLLPNDTNSFRGMPGAGFGLHDDQALRIHRGLSGEELLQPEDGLKFATGGKIGIEKSPLIGMITIKKDDPIHWIMAGRVFERIFLTLENEGINVAIHAGIVEVTLVNRIFAATLGTMRRLAVLFRAGRLKDEKQKERPHSPRLPIEKIILKIKP